MKFRVIRPTVFPHAPESMIAAEQRILDAVDAELVPIQVTPAELANHVAGADGLITTSQIGRASCRERVSTIV